MTETGRLSRKSSEESSERYLRLFITQRERLDALGLSEKEILGQPKNFWYLVAHKLGEELGEERKKEQHEVITYSAELSKCILKLTGLTKLDRGDVELLERILRDKQFEDTEEQQVLTAVTSQPNQLYLHGVRQGLQEILLREEAQEYFSLVAIAAPGFGRGCGNNIQLFDKVPNKRYSLVVSFRADKRRINLDEEMKKPQCLVGSYNTLESCLESAERKGFPYTDLTQRTFFSELLCGDDANRQINMIGYCSSKECEKSLALMRNNGELRIATGRDLYMRLKKLSTALAFD